MFVGYYETEISVEDRRDMNRDKIKVRKCSFQIICMTNVAITTSKHVMKLHLKDDESKCDIYSTK